MNLNNYETKYFPIYKAFAETVRFILRKAILAADNLPRPQSIQYRAKGVERLRRRLGETGKLDTQRLEYDRRDLAGVRIIFYTKESLTNWLTDERLEVKAFAEKHMAELDRMIASEQRSAELRKEMRKRDYEEDDTDSDNSIANKGDQ